MCFAYILREVCADLCYGFSFGWLGIGVDVCVFSYLYKIHAREAESSYTEYYEFEKNEEIISVITNFKG